MKDASVTRRKFLKQSAGLALSAGIFPSIIPASALGRSGAIAPGNRIVVGCIGTGPQGRGVMSNFLNQTDVQVRAVCDVKTDQLEVARRQVNEHYQNSDCATSRDFRELIERKDIDALLIATPDHWHVLIALAAVRAGKDIYLEKPMGLNLAENWTLRKEVHRRKRVFQFGTQQRSSRIFRQACELVRNGRIGKLKHINAWAPGSAPGGSTEIVPVPAGMDYDMWLGPAPFKPYTQDRCSHDGGKKTWWYISDYTLGFLAGWGIHPLDIAAWGGGDSLSGPVEIEGRATFRCDGICDTAIIWNVQFTFGSGVTMTFVGVPNGGNRGQPTGDPWLNESEWRQRYGRITTHGTAFEGADGWVHVDRDGIKTHPENLIEEDSDALNVRLRRSPNHVRNFVDCIRSRAETVCPIDDSVWSDTLCHLADMATRLNRKIVWDPKKQRFQDDAEANLRLRARDMRPPWRLA